MTVTAEFECIALFEDIVDAKSAGNLRRYFQGIRELYDAVMPDILADGLRPSALADWSRIMSPIEREVWIDINQFQGRFWPQFPSCGYFLDFADPITLLAIECDGSGWHDEAKDARRDSILRRRGWWNIFRLPGKEIWKDFTDDGGWREEPMARWTIRQLCLWTTNRSRDAA